MADRSVNRPGYLLGGRAGEFKPIEKRTFLDASQAAVKFSETRAERDALAPEPWPIEQMVTAQQMKARGYTATQVAAAVNRTVDDVKASVDAMPKATGARQARANVGFAGAKRQ